MHGLENKWQGRVAFSFLDIDDSRTTPFKQQLGYRYQPHIFLLDGDGEIVQQWVGYVEARDLDDAISELAN